MKRINTATAVNGMFVDGNRALGQKATQFSAEWCNTIQEELCAIVELITGTAVTGSSNHEVIDALNGNRTFRSVKVGSAELSVVPGLGESLRNLAALSAGVIEALMKFKVGGSQWTPGNNQPKIEGLYGLEAGNVGTTNLQADTIDAHGKGVSTIQVKKRLVRDNAPGKENEPLLLGPTQVGGGLKVTGNLDAFGGLTLTNHIWNASASDIVDKMNSLENGQVAVIFNSGSSDVSFPAAQGSPNPRSFSVPHDASVLVVKSGGRIYPAGGVL